MNKKEIIGHWKFENGNIIADSNCEIIKSMIKNDLTKIGKSEDGWIIQYKANDDSIWELSYPQSHYQGGGPPKLVQIQ